MGSYHLLFGELEPDLLGELKAAARSASLSLNSGGDRLLRYLGNTAHHDRRGI